jgi:hypothetical protein
LFLDQRQPCGTDSAGRPATGAHVGQPDAWAGDAIGGGGLEQLENYHPKSIGL